VLLRRVRLSPFRLELRHAVVTARGSTRSRTGFLIELEDEAGRVGIGEATPYPLAGTEGLAACQSALLSALELLSTGRVPSDPKRVDRVLDAIGDLRKAPAARFGVELALLDLIAQRRQLPLARLFRANAGPTVQVSVLLPHADPAVLARTTRRLVRGGFQVFKIKIGAAPLARDRARVAAVREAAGPRARLRLDANGAFGGVAAALAALRQLHEFRIEFCEEPLARPTPAALARLRKRSPIPIAADESLASPERALGFVRQRSVDVLVLKPMVLGGVMRALALARRARAAGIRSLATTTLDGVVARLGAAHLAAALPPCGLASGLATGSLIQRDLRADPSKVSRGWLQLPRGPGLGFSGRMRR
jgi:o-succinylbenzoate synthase